MSTYILDSMSVRNLKFDILDFDNIGASFLNVVLFEIKMNSCMYVW
jgi:hypothetical protein